MIQKVHFENYKGARREHDLQRLNLVTGPNGSGKTAIGNAIHIALKGRHPSLGENLQAIRKECSADTAVFEVVDDALSVRRELSFGDKTTHQVWVNGVEAKVKEAQADIDAIYPDSITRLDIGKFSKMNDIERGIVLSELLGSAKMAAEELAEEIIALFFKSNPESEYIIKYRLSGKYDNKGFISAMRELYADKNPVILEMLDTCGKILKEQKGLVEVADYLDYAFEAVKKYRNSKNQEKVFAQKAFAEISTGMMDSGDIQRQLEENDKARSRADKDAALLTSLKAMSPDPTGNELPEDCDGLIAFKVAELQSIKDDLAALQLRYQELNGEEQLMAAHRNWIEKVATLQDSIETLKKTISEQEKAIQPVSKEKDSALEKKRAAYLSLKSLSPGECPTCGTVISEEASNQRKADIRQAKKAWDEAEAELKLRQANSFAQAKIELANKQLVEAIKVLQEQKAKNPAKPKRDSNALLKDRTDAREQEIKLLEKRDVLQKNLESLNAAKSMAEGRAQAEQKYRNLLSENAGFFSAWDITADNQQPALDKAIAEVQERRQGLERDAIRLRAAEQMTEKLAKDQERILDLQVAYDTLNTVADIIRQYKNDAVEKKIAPVQVLAKKYYHNPGDEIVVTPKTIGVKRGNQYIEQSAMSAGESLSLMSAVLIAIMEISQARPNYLFVDAAEIDEKNIGILLEALTKSSLDMVLVAHHMPITPPEGWNHIKVG